MRAKLLTALLALSLLLAASGCALIEKKPEDTTAATEATSDLSTETTTPEEDGRGGLPTYERDTTEEKIPSETKFGDGELGRKEELSDVAP